LLSCGIFPSTRPSTAASAPRWRNAVFRGCGGWTALPGPGIRAQETPISDWDAQQYERFGEERLRPARDLLAGVPAIDARRIYDLGCGSGLSTSVLAARWPDARITGIDRSQAMLARARERLPGVHWVQADIAQFDANELPELVFANASLHWLADHRRLLPRLLSLLSPGGVLAVQMPDNLDEPSHRLMRELAGRDPWPALLGALRGERQRLLAAVQYYDCLAPLCSAVNLWTTRYHHVLPGADAILDWFAGTALKPYLDALPESAREDFRAAYLRELERAYPRRGDGRVLLEMPRLFLVAQRPD
jgi:trans-aconitate 2-methyltransferase